MKLWGPQRARRLSAPTSWVPSEPLILSGLESRQVSNIAIHDKVDALLQVQVASYSLVNHCVIRFDTAQSGLKWRRALNRWLSYHAGRTSGLPLRDLGKSVTHFAFAFVCLYLPPLAVEPAERCEMTAHPIHKMFIAQLRLGIDGRTLVPVADSKAGGFEFRHGLVEQNRSLQEEGGSSQVRGAGL